LISRGIGESPGVHEGGNDIDQSQYTEARRCVTQTNHSTPRRASACHAASGSHRVCTKVGMMWGGKS